MREKSTDRETSLKASLPTRFSTLFGSEHVPLRYNLVRLGINIKRIEYIFMTFVLCFLRWLSFNMVEWLSQLKHLLWNNGSGAYFLVLELSYGANWLPLSPLARFLKFYRKELLLLIILDELKILGVF